MRDVWREGEAASLKRAGEPAIVLRIARGAQRIGTEGVLDVSGQLGQVPGGEVEWLGEKYRLVRPSLSDLLGSLRRGAQIVMAKDALYLGFLGGVGPGLRVLEAGTGSGALTIALAHAVGPSGRVTTYDRRADFLKVAERNVREAGLSERVVFRERDVASEGFDEVGVASVLLDLPEPWAILPFARAALVSGGFVATYSPTYNQVERTVRALRDEGFDEVRAVELLERAIHVGEGGTRPEFDMLGHTGFLAAGRRVA